MKTVRIPGDNPPTVRWYILEGKTPVPADTITAGMWMEHSGEQRKVAATRIKGAFVSTVFLGLDHRWGEGPPILFETLVFGGKLEGEMNRYTTWDEAERGHQDMVRQVTDAEGE